MCKVTLKQLLALSLAVMMLRPYPTLGAPSAAVLGSISSYGAVMVGDLTSPAKNTLFAGDRVHTQRGSAVVQYKEGTRVRLATNTTARFTAADVQLQAGQMSLHTGSEKGPVFLASSLRLEPATNSSVNVTLNDGRASINVAEGAVRVVDPTGVPLASIQPGETRLFAMASAVPALPAGATVAPQAGVETMTIWLLILGVASFFTVFGIYQLTDEDAPEPPPVSPFVP